MSNFLSSAVPRPVSDEFYTGYTLPYSGIKSVKDSNGVSTLPPGVQFVPGSKKTKIFTDNPLLTDTSQIVQTDIKTILQQNPDINGLSLLIDDPAQPYADSVSIEDFIPPSNYVDIFDVHDFVKNAERSFNSLPASFRKLYNNSYTELCSALSSSVSRTAAMEALGKYIDVSLNSSNSGSTPAVGSQLTPETSQNNSTQNSESLNNTNNNN